MQQTKALSDNVVDDCDRTALLRHVIRTADAASYWYVSKPGELFNIISQTPLSKNRRIFVFTADELRALHPDLPELFNHLDAQQDADNKIGWAAIRIAQTLDFWENPPFIFPPEAFVNSGIDSMPMAELYAVPYQEAAYTRFEFKSLELETTSGGIDYVVAWPYTMASIKNSWLAENLPGWENRYHAASALGLSFAQTTRFVTDQALDSHITALPQLA